MSDTRADVISSAERQAMLRVVGGMGPGVVTEFLHWLHVHVPRMIVLPLLERLIKDRLTGQTLAEKLTHEFCRNHFDFYRFALARLQKSNAEHTPIVAGKNFKSV